MRGHDLEIIDQNPEAFERLPRGCATTRVGKVFDRETLEAAGIDHADAYVAVTSGDNSNVVSAIVAKEEYRVPLVLSRIYDPRRAEIYRRLGIPAVSSVAWSVNEVLSLLLHREMTTDATFGDGEVRLVSVEAPVKLVGRRVGELTRHGQIAIVAIVRAGRSFMPTDAVEFAQHDIVHIAVAASALPDLEQMLRP
jgi:trk system potassium uptake protein TrkA